MLRNQRLGLQSSFQELLWQLLPQLQEHRPARSRLEPPAHLPAKRYAELLTAVLQMRLVQLPQPLSDFVITCGEMTASTKQYAELLKAHWTLNSQAELYIVKMITLSDNSVQKLVHHWWQAIGYPALNNQLEKIRQTFGAVWHSQMWFDGCLGEQGLRTYWELQWC